MVIDILLTVDDAQRLSALDLAPDNRLPGGLLGRPVAGRRTGGLLSVLLVAILVLEFGSLAIRAVEEGRPGSDIRNAPHATWYVSVTMSTVGYGDRYPVTDAGRLIGSLIIVVRVGVFGTLTGFLANACLAPRDAASVVVPPDLGPELEHDPRPSATSSQP